MNKILEMLLQALTASGGLATLITFFLTKLLEDVQDVSGHKERWLQMLRSGTLDDEFAKDPLGVIICGLAVLVALADQMHPHVHGAASDADGAYPGELASAMGLSIPAEGGLDVIIPILIEQGIKLLVSLIEKWSNR